MLAAALIAGHHADATSLRLHAGGRGHYIGSYRGEVLDFSSSAEMRVR